MNGMVFGKDVLFSYGPLGYLFYPFALNTTLWIQAVIFRASLHAMFYLFLLILVLRNGARPFDAVLIAFSATIVEATIQIAYLLAAVILVCAVLLITEKHYTLFPLLSGLGATAPFFKADIGMASLLTTVVGASWIYFRGNRRVALLSLTTWFSVFLVAGAALTRSIESLDSFVAGSYQISIGYGPAMYFPGPLWQEFVGILAITALGLILIRELWIKRLSPITVLSLGFLFLALKEGFVRQDPGHVIIFFGAWALFFGLLQLREQNRLIRKGCFLILVLLLASEALTFLPYAGTWLPGGTYSATNLAQTVELVSNPADPSRMFSSSLLRTRNQYSLSKATVAELDGHSVDIFPWDVAIAPAYGMTWDPRPVFQSYQAYTSYLDELNSRHFLSSNSPEFVLYRAESIDDRYPLFDEPLTLLALACNYESTGFDGVYMILHRVGNHCGSPQAIQTFESTFGATIQIPSNESGFTLAEVRLQYSLIGSLRSLLYKPIPAYIELRFSDGAGGVFRFLPENAGDGLMVSAIPSSLFGGEIRQIHAFRLLTDVVYGFDPNISVTFVRIPVLNSSIATVGGSNCCSQELSEADLSTSMTLFSVAVAAEKLYLLYTYLLAIGFAVFEPRKAVAVSGAIIWTLRNLKTPTTEFYIRLLHRM
jgi:hypothetical protein